LLYFITLFNFLNFAFCRLILRNAMLIIVSRRCRSSVFPLAAPFALSQGIDVLSDIASSAHIFILRRILVDWKPNSGMKKVYGGRRNI